MALHDPHDGAQLLRADSLVKLAGDLTYAKHRYSLCCARDARKLCKALDFLRLLDAAILVSCFSQQLSFPSIVGFAVDTVGCTPFSHGLPAAAASGYAFFPCDCTVSLFDCYDCYLLHLRHSLVSRILEIASHNLMLDELRLTLTLAQKQAAFVSCINQFHQDTFFCSMANLIHPSNPLHLMLRFQLLRDSFLLHQPRHDGVQSFLCLFV